MSLPKVNYVTHLLKMKEFDTKIKYRPFNNREHRILLEAKESGNAETMASTTMDVLKACTFNKVDFENKPPYVIDFAFMKVHTSSVGNVQEIGYTCTQDVEKEKDDGSVVTEPCGTNFGVKVDLSKIKIEYPSEKLDVIKIDETSGISMKIPTFKEVEYLVSKEDASEDDYIFACIKNVYDEDNIYEPGIDFNKDSFDEWLGELPVGVSEKMAKYFDNLPHISLKFDLVCPSCRHKEKVTLEDLKDFFL